MTEPRTVSSDYSDYRNTFIGSFRQIINETPPRELDEAAFPAYSHPNPIINWIYWRRLKAVMDEIKLGGEIDCALDFGCGSGVLLPFLAFYAKQVIGADLDTAPFYKMQKYIDFPDTIEILDLNRTALETLPSETVDLLTALNVLEHIDDPTSAIDQFFRILKPNGKMIVALPKENTLYRFARKLAGKEFTGNYHSTTYDKVEVLCAAHGQLNFLLKHSIFNNVFHIFSAVKR